MSRLHIRAAGLAAIMVLASAASIARADDSVQQRTLTPEQRAAIVSFAKGSKPQHIMVMARDGTEPILYADEIANAFEVGGWTVDGRRSDGQRFVTHQLGAALPGEVSFAIGPDGPDASKLAAALDKVGLHAKPLPSEDKRGDEIVIWVGAQKPS
jgi:hypothetical protein